MNTIECLGLLATLLVVASFLFQNIVLIRSVNMVGAILFVAYGYLIHSPSVAILNTVMIFVQIVQLIKIYRKNRTQQHEFKLPVIQ